MRDTRVFEVVSQQPLRLSIALYRRHRSNEQLKRAFSIFALEKSIQNRLSDRTSMEGDWDSVPLSFLCGPPNATTNLLRPFSLYKGRDAFP